MIKNYLSIALRNFAKHKVFTLINILSLTIGISACLVIYLFVRHEFGFEKFHQEGHRIYRIVTNMHFPDSDFKNSGVPGPLPAAVREEIPGLETSTSFWINHASQVTVPSDNGKPKVFKSQKKIIYADNNYFKFFSYKWLAGAPDFALNEPRRVVLTEARAKNYFDLVDARNAVGKTIIYQDTMEVVVSGVVEELDGITDFTFQEFVSISTYENWLKSEGGLEEWGSVNSSSQFFIKLEEGIDPVSINNNLAEVRKKRAADNSYLDTEHFLQPLYDIHFNAEFDNFSQRMGHKPTLYGLMVVGALIILLGCINFINLTTAQSVRRAKEIGIRKTVGSSKKQLVVQFLCETTLLTLVAALLSLAIAPQMLTVFSEYLPDDLGFKAAWTQPYMYAFMFALVALVSLLSGFYPAFVLSRHQPVLVLKNQLLGAGKKGSEVWVRKILTVSQFVIAQVFIIATMVAASQIRYSLNKDLGFKKDAILFFHAPYDYRNPDNKQFVLQEKLKTIPDIKRISLAGAPPTFDGSNFSTMKFTKDGKEIETTLEIKTADTSYLSLYGIQLLAGRNLQPSDTVREYLVNEAYLKFLGYNDPSEIIGKGFSRGNSSIIPIVGVVADFHSKSLHHTIHPLAFSCQASNHHTFHIALDAASKNTDIWKNTISSIQEAWKEVYTEADFEYTFFDESIAKFYEKDQQTAKLLGWSTGVTIFISCLGLLGLVMFSTVQRTKEIGIRKVMGATVFQIITLLSSSFLWLVLIAFAIAAPIGWFAMNKWLENYAFRIEIEWWIFLFTALSSIAIAFATLSFQSIKAALVNPVEALRQE